MGVAGSLACRRDQRGGRAVVVFSHGASVPRISWSTGVVGHIDSGGIRIRRVHEAVALRPAYMSTSMASTNFWSIATSSWSGPWRFSSRARALSAASCACGKQHRYPNAVALLNQAAAR